MSRSVLQSGSTLTAPSTGAITDAQLPVTAQAATLSATYVTYTPDGQDALLSQRATPLIPWTSAVANRDNARATCLILGDSITEGSYITALNNVWGHRLAATLRNALPLANGSTRGGQGIFLPNQNANVGFTAPLVPVGSGTAPAGSGYWGLSHRGAVLACITPAPAANGALTATAGGTLAATNYFVRSTWTNAAGETLAAPETSLAVAVNSVLNVAAPASPPAAATGWNVYVSTATGTETRQNGATPVALGTAWVEPTTGLVAGVALPATQTTAQTMTFTTPGPATGVDIEWVAGYSAADTMSVSVDGGAVTTYSGLAQNTATYQRIAFASRTTHTVNIACTVGTVVLNGVHVYDGDESSGIHVLVSGRAGALSSDYISTDSVTTGTQKQSYTLAAPDLTVIELGTNDFLQQVAVATFKANLTQLIGDVSAAAPKTCFILLTPPTPHLSGGIPWSQYLTAIKQVAAGRTDTVTVDLGRRIYPAGGTDPQALFYDTVVHPNNKGAALYAQLVGQALTDGVLGGPATYTHANTWVTPTLINAWASYGAPFANASYRIDSSGVVELQGTLKLGNATAGTVLFNLPPGYRTNATKIFATASADAFGEIRITATGDVTINAGTNTWLSLDGIRFLAEG